MTTVYLVDDDPLVTDSLGTAFRLETAYDIHVFQSGPSALVALSGTPPDVVISDFKMPGMDGLALLRAVRQAVPDAVLMLLNRLCGQGKRDPGYQPGRDLSVC